MKTILSAALIAAPGSSIIGCNSSNAIGRQAVSAQTAESRAYLHSYNLPSHGVALEGYCPVAYFAVNKPVKGKAEHASTYKNVTYYFVSADAKKAFDAEPEKFVPAYGGWCAFGMSIGDKFSRGARDIETMVTSRCCK
jgi:YHS domain-containing protein